MNAQILRARTAQAAWAERPLRDRLAVITRLRRTLARHSRGLAATAVRPNMTEADVLVAEVMPFLAACRFLENQAPKLLATRRPDGGRPVWLIGTRLVVRRVPFGVVLILAPRNYPLLLAAVQIVQALTAGNAVLVKPAPGCAAPVHALAEALQRAGLPEALCTILPDSHEAGEQALAAGADKVILTGGVSTGRLVLARLAETLTPATMELSGDDAAIVLPGAPLAAVARAIAYGLTLNGGETCIAPRRIIAVGDTGPPLAEALVKLLPTLPPCHVPPQEADRITQAVALAEAAGGRRLGDPPAQLMRPLVMLAATSGSCLPPLFGPVASLMMAPGPDEAVVCANASPYALGASVFGPPAAAGEVARRLRAGCITVNDVIVATADPRAPFGGAGASGFGVTRGADGLLEMTRPQAILSRRRIVATLYQQLPSRTSRWIARALRLLYQG